MFKKRFRLIVNYKWINKNMCKLIYLRMQKLLIIPPLNFLFLGEFGQILKKLFSFILEI